MKKIRVGVAGYGTIGQRLADGVAMQEDMELLEERQEDYEDTITARMDALVAAYNPQNIETTLWTGTGKISGSTYTLEESVADYDYLDIYIYNHGAGTAHRIPVSDNTLFLLREFNLSDYAAGGSSVPVIEGGEFEVSFHTTTMTIANHSWYQYNSDDDNTPAGGNVTALSTENQLAIAGYISKVVGIKEVVNTEVEDIRVGYDGTTYNSAGTAVRTQVSDIYTDLNDVIAAITTEETFNTSNIDPTGRNINASNKYSTLAGSSTRRNKWITIPEGVMNVTLIPADITFTQDTIGMLYAFLQDDYPDDYVANNTPVYAYPSTIPDKYTNILPDDLETSYTFRIYRNCKTLFLCYKYGDDTVMPTVKFSYYPVALANDGDTF